MSWLGVEGRAALLRLWPVMWIGQKWGLIGRMEMIEWFGLVEGWKD